MKLFRRILQALLLLLIVAIISGTIFLNHLKKRAIPDYGEPVNLENLQEEVTVYRDSLAIPHVYAKNEQDLYRVVGYLTAQDRLWQMDLLRRITMGRLSEIFGPDMISADQMFRAFDFSGKSHRVLEKTDPEILRCLEAYTDGVNQYINKNRKNRPFEFTMLGYRPEPWTTIHTANLIGYMAWDLTSGWNTDMTLHKLSAMLSDTLLQELTPRMDIHRTTVFPGTLPNEELLTMESPMEEAVQAIEKLGLQVFRASNNWAVSGKKSKTGMPLLANDMHLGFMSPGIWYQMHQVVEGELNVTGVVLPGQPYVICGHNEEIAWGMTNLTVDNLDFYLETVNPEDSGQYRLNGRWLDMRTEKEVIRLDNGDSVERVNRFTHRGPVVSRFKGVDDQVITARWIGTDYSNELRSVHLFNRASNWEEFRDAASTFIAVSQNIVYADRQGNIGLQAAGGVPIRQGNGISIYPGDTTQYDWEGIVPFEELPYSYNPENGMVSSANNRTVGEEYPHYIGSWYSLPNRINRIREMLTAKEKLGIDDFRAMHADQLSAFARKLTPVLLEATEGRMEGVSHEALELMKTWDYRMDKDAPQPLIYEQFFIELIRTLYRDELGEEHFPMMLQQNIFARYHIYRLAETGTSAFCDNVETEGTVETFTDNLQEAFAAAVDTLGNRLEGEPASWQWGDLHTFTLKHPMGGVAIVNRIFNTNKGPYPADGSFHTVAPFSYPLGSGYGVTHGASQRHIYSTADWDRSQTVIPTGTSGVPASPYYCNQTELYLDYGYHADPFSKEEVRKHARFEAIYR